MRRLQRLFRARPSGPDAGLTPVLVDVMHGRVGSTLLMQLLGTSPHVAFDRTYPFENRYLTQLVRIAAALGDHEFGADAMPAPFSWERGLLTLSDFGPRAMRALWNAFAESVVTTAAVPPRYYAEKILFPAELLSSSGVDVRVVFLVRDPRDVFVSIRSFNERRGFHAFGRDAFETEAEYLVWFVEFIRLRLQSFEQQSTSSNVLLFRYEDLVVDLEAASRRLESWLGLRFDAPAIPSRRVDFAQHITSESPSLSVGRWQRELDARDADYIGVELRELLLPLGYDI